MPAPDSDPSSLLSGIRGRYVRASAQSGAAARGDYIKSAADVPCLLAAVEAALKHHVPRTKHHDEGDSFRHCSTCSGHPAWPCPEVAAITTALGGTQPGEENHA